MRFLTSNSFWIEVVSWNEFGRGLNIHCDDRSVCFASIIRVRDDVPDRPVEAGYVTREEADLLAKHLDTVLIMRGDTRKGRRNFIKNDLTERGEADGVLRAEAIFNEKFAYKRKKRSS